MSEAGIRIRFQLSFFISNLGCTTGRLGPCGIHIMGRGPPIPGGGGGGGARPFREAVAGKVVESPPLAS